MSADMCAEMTPSSAELNAEMDTCGGLKHHSHPGMSTHKTTIRVLHSTSADTRQLLDDEVELPELSVDELEVSCDLNGATSESDDSPSASASARAPTPSPVGYQSSIAIGGTPLSKSSS